MDISQINLILRGNAYAKNVRFNVCRSITHCSRSIWTINNRVVRPVDTGNALSVAKLIA